MNPVNTLILSAQQVKKVLPLDDALYVLSEAHVAYSNGMAVQPNRLQLPVEKHNGRLLVMTSFVEPLDALVVKVIGGFHDNPRRGLPAGYGLVVLHDAETGAIASIMDGFYLTGFRTAATAVLASKVLSNPEPKVLAVIGGGFIGQISALCSAKAFNLTRIIVFSRTNKTANSFKVALEPEIDAPIDIATSPKDACEDADIIITATASKVPVIRHEWIKPGCHVNAVGSSLPTSREVDTAIVQNSVVIVESMEATMAEAGDILIPLRAGDVGSDVVHAELGEVIAKRKTGRGSNTDITLFKSVGIASQDAAIAQLAYRNAMDQHIGTEIELT
jgi:ornithine cyclodeaminase